MSRDPDFLKMINLASEKLGARALLCSDDFFAPMENLLKAGRGVFIAEKYTDRGKWMDGWESRRKRDPGHDWCIIKLGAAGIIHGLDVDTNHFLGNHPPYCSVEACVLNSEALETAEWVELLSKSRLNPGSQHYFEIFDDRIWTHVRLHIYPDGGVARLKVYGEVKKDWSPVDKDTYIDLAAAVNGGKCISCNDMFFSHMDNLIMPGKGENMGDGWETKRNRTPENRDWVTIRLAHPGWINKLSVDTHHFKGNYPDSCLLEACYSTDQDLHKAKWYPLFPQSKLSAHAEHIFENSMHPKKEFSHVRLSIFPDGGVSRLRVWGNIRRPNMRIDQFHTLDEVAAKEHLTRCCGSKRWVDLMWEKTPYSDLADLLTKADEAWALCNNEDALEAFDHHPKIGGKDKLAEKFASTSSWASAEQSGVDQANDEVLERLAEANRIYEEKFGYIFIVFATGKTAGQMLDILEERLQNDQDTEIEIAKKEQHKITRLRLEKLLQ